VTSRSALYSHPREFEPLLPERRRQALTERAAEVAKRSIALTGAVHPATVESLRTLLRSMNSYYSNRIEGQGTHPLDIERALRNEYSRSAPKAKLQRLAVAHIKAEEALEALSVPPALTMEFLRRAHRELYGCLPDADRTTDGGTSIVPGEYRTTQVSVGRHVAPDAVSLNDFGRRFDSFYGTARGTDETLLAVAAAHHRASWVHPFEDGSGRAVRLQTQCALHPFTNGLWSVSRGLARNRDNYYQHLAEADAPRAGDLDGRGSLSDAGLARWCEWFIDLCADQVDFMTRLLDLDGIRRRVTALITSRAAEDSGYRTETITALFHLFATGPTARGEFLRMTGLGERTARSALAHLINSGLVTSPSHRGPVRIAFPLDSLQLLLPDLYPEAATMQSGP
jgi:Fic family protein